MADKPERQSFNFANQDWDGYIKYRPVYPAEVYNTIYSYHDSHGGRYDAAVDIGAGVGIVGAELTKRFAHVTVTDPAQHYVDAARNFFAQYATEGVDFLQTKAEEVNVENLPKGQKVDMVTAAECLHWAYVDVASPRIADVLKPGGTFAGWLYGVRPLLDERDENLSEAREIFFDIYDKMIDEYSAKIEKRDVDSGGAAMNARLDHMPFSSLNWTDVRRIHNNRDAPMASASWPVRPSNVSEREKVESFDEENLICYNADYEYLEGYLVHWIPPIKVKDFAKTELARLEKAMGGRKLV
jgi:SAM-dependent methyltransferase